MTEEQKYYECMSMKSRATELFRQVLKHGFDDLDFILEELKQNLEDEE